MIWTSFKDKKEAKESYETYKGKKARMLYYTSVVEQDPTAKSDEDKTLIDNMKEFAEKTYGSKDVNKDGAIDWRDKIQIFLMESFQAMISHCSYSIPE